MMELYPYQQEAVDNMVAWKKCLNASDMGLGKTPETLVAIDTLACTPALIVCPATLKEIWRRETVKWLGCSVQILKSDTRSLVSINIVNYELLSRGVQVINPRKKDANGNSPKPRTKYVYSGLLKFLQDSYLECIVGDESHYLKTSKSLRRQAFHSISKNLDVVFLLTGTPILSKPVELISQLRIIDKFEKKFGNYQDFVYRYCDAYQSNFGLETSGATFTEELNERLLDRIMIRHRKEDHLPGLPDKRFVTLPFEIDNKEEYQKAEEEIVEYVVARASKDRDFNVSIDHLSENDREEAMFNYLEDIKQTVERTKQLQSITHLRRLASAGKYKGVLEWVEEFLVSGEKILIFTAHNEPLEMFNKDIPKSMIIRGGQSSKKRQQSIDSFQDGDVQVLISNIQAGGIGLTLTSASNVLFHEYEWTPALISQAVDRVHRISQTSSVTAWFTVAMDTIDEDMVDILDNKSDVFSAVVDGRKVDKGRKLSAIYSRIKKRIKRKKS